MHHMLSVTVLLAAVGLSASGIAGSLTDGQIRQLIIQDSIATFPGGCPCPYDLAANGTQCGSGSAWSGTGRYSPLCYANDIDDDMVKAYRQQHGLSQ